MPNLLIFVALVLVPTLVDASECNPERSRQELSACAENEYNAAREVMNTFVAAHVSTLSAGARDEYLALHRTWEIEQATQCRSEAADVEGGAAWPTKYFDCLSATYRQRLDALRVKPGDTHRAWQP